MSIRLLSLSLSLLHSLRKLYLFYVFFLSIVLLLPYIQDGYVEVHTFRMEFLFIKWWKTTAKTCQAKWKKTLNWQKVSIAFSHFIQNRESARVWAGEKRRVTQLFLPAFFSLFSSQVLSFFWYWSSKMDTLNFVRDNRQNPKQKSFWTTFAFLVWAGINLIHV